MDVRGRGEGADATLAQVGLPQKQPQHPGSMRPTRRRTGATPVPGLFAAFPDRTTLSADLPSVARDLGVAVTSGRAPTMLPPVPRHAEAPPPDPPC